MNKPIIAALFCFWMYLAYNAFSAGNAPKAALFAGIGVALTAYRLKGAQGG